MKKCSNNDGKGCEPFNRLIGAAYVMDVQDWNFCTFCGKPMKEDNHAADGRKTDTR